MYTVYLFLSFKFDPIWSYKWRIFRCHVSSKGKHYQHRTHHLKHHKGVIFGHRGLVPSSHCSGFPRFLGIKKSQRVAIRKPLHFITPIDFKHPWHSWFEGFIRVNPPALRRLCWLTSHPNESTWMLASIGSTWWGLHDLRLQLANADSNPYCLDVFYYICQAPYKTLRSFSSPWEDFFRQMSIRKFSLISVSDVGKYPPWK